MKWFDYDNDEFTDFEEDYEIAQNAEYNIPPEFNISYRMNVTYSWKELQNAWKALNLNPHNYPANIEATPDDWLDTVVWIKGLKEVK